MTHVAYFSGMLAAFGILWGVLPELTTWPAWLWFAWVSGCGLWYLACTRIWGKHD